ncbi:uncharacterized protein LOC136078275 [Hydra vulgaris]|uniref:Uncharacterized protein LOC136078275 n=1 Tax=Hydra vulgaris TaxID=6087 RepID=A0ABM4BL57_HYDVU
MDPIDFSIEDVLEKWNVLQQDCGKKCDTSNDSLWYRQKTSFSANTLHRKKRTSNKQVGFTNVQPRKFCIQPPTLQTCFQTYQISACKLCQNIIESVEINESSLGQTVDLFKFIEKHKGITERWFYQLFKNTNSPVFFQSKDRLLLQKINKNRHPLIFIHDGCSLIHTIYVYIYIAAILGEIPAVFINEKLVSSFLLRYFMEKIGFVFMKEPSDVIMKLGSLHEAEKCVILPNSACQLSISNLLLNEIRIKGCKPNALIIPIACSTENKNSGITYLSLSMPIYLKSLLDHSHNMNEHNIKDEENNLINRHLNYDFFQASAVLPVHLLSYTFLVLHRKGLSREKLKRASEEILEELKSMDVFLGFSGDIESVIAHGVEVLCNQSLLLVIDGIVLPQINDSVKAFHLFSYSLKIFQIMMPKAILACSLISTIGGEIKLRQGYGEPFTFKTQTVIENAEFLAELFSYMFDYHCPFSVFSSTIMDTFDKFVAMDIITSQQQHFEDQAHKKLSQSVNAEFIDEEEEVFGGADADNSQIFEFLPSESNIQLLSNWRACVIPFIEIAYLIANLIHIKKTGEHFSSMDIFNLCLQRFKDGLFENGEILDQSYVTKFLEYLFEKEYVDDVDDENTFVKSSISGQTLNQLLVTIVKYRI